MLRPKIDYEVKGTATVKQIFAVTLPGDKKKKTPIGKKKDSV